MSTPQHRIDKRAERLGQLIEQRVESIAKAFGDGGTPAFRTALPEREALEWWKRNRHTPIGMQALSLLKPEEVLELDLALNRLAQAEEQATLPSIEGMV